MYDKEAFKGEAPKSWSVVFEEQQLPDGKPNKGRCRRSMGRSTSPTPRST
jgi:spermidine/putrescine-binding protein